jgi:hypothetical protein
VAGRLGVLYLCLDKNCAPHLQIEVLLMVG